MRSRSLYMYAQLMFAMHKRLLPCVAWSQTCFHFRPTTTHNNLLHSQIFFNPCILRNPQVKDFTGYGDKEKPSLKPETFSLSNTDSRHWKVLDILDKNGSKLLKTLKVDPGLSNFQLSHLSQTQTASWILQREEPTSGTKVHRSVTWGRSTCLCFISEAFKRIKKGPDYYRRILLIHHFHHIQELAGKTV